MENSGSSPQREQNSADTSSGPSHTQLPAAKQPRVGPLIGATPATVILLVDPQGVVESIESISSARSCNPPISVNSSVARPVSVHSSVHPSISVHSSTAGVQTQQGMNIEQVSVHSSIVNPVSVQSSVAAPISVLSSPRGLSPTAPVETRVPVQMQPQAPVVAPVQQISQPVRVDMFDPYQRQEAPIAFMPDTFPFPQDLPSVSNIVARSLSFLQPHLWRQDLLGTSACARCGNIAP